MLPRVPIGCIFLFIASAATVGVQETARLFSKAVALLGCVLVSY